MRALAPGLVMTDMGERMVKWRSTTPGSPAAAWQARQTERLAGVLEKYARLVGPANLGGVTHAGAVDWPLE